MDEVTIKIRANGPYLVSGPINLVDAEGNAVDYDRSRGNVALCRCGGSTNKPFCDGTHSALGFAAATRAVAETE